MVTVQKLAQLQKKAAALERRVAETRQRELRGLPETYGFSDVEAFIDAVFAAGGRRRRANRNASRGATGRRPRTTITDAMRSEVKRLVKAGKTGAEIARLVDISVPSVHNIKTALGLVRSRK